jgi:hypothetical protein
LIFSIMFWSFQVFCRIVHGCLWLLDLWLVKYIIFGLLDKEGFNFNSLGSSCTNYYFKNVFTFPKVFNFLWLKFYSFKGYSPNVIVWKDVDQLDLDLIWTFLKVSARMSGPNFGLFEKNCRVIFILMTRHIL